MRRTVNMHGLGAAPVLDPLGQPMGSDALPGAQASTCQAAGHPITDQAFSNWFNGVFRAAGEPLGGEAGPACPIYTPAVLCAKQRLGLTDAEVACILQTMAPYNPDFTAYTDWLKGQGLWKIGNAPGIIAAGGVQSPAWTPADVQAQQMQQPVSMVQQTGGAPVTSAPVSTVQQAGGVPVTSVAVPPVATVLPSGFDFSTIPWWGWAAAAAAALYLFSRS